MNNFTYQLIKDYFIYYIIQPDKTGKKIIETTVNQFVENVIKKKKDLPAIINTYKKELKQNHNRLTIEDLGAGTKKQEGNSRKISNIAKYAASSKRKATLLYNIVLNYKPKTIIELGTSLGIGTMSLALANGNATIYTIEGCESILKTARDAFGKFNIKNIQTVNGDFDTELPILLNNLKNPDIIFIDGNHTREAALRYLRLISSVVQNETILIFDDIRWSEGMYSAWLNICAKPEIKISIDLLDIGIVFLNSKINKQHYRIYY